MLSAGEFGRFLGDSMLEASTRAMLPGSLTSRVFHSLTVRSVTALLTWITLSVSHVFVAWATTTKKESTRLSMTDEDGFAQHGRKIKAQLIYEYLKEPIFDEDGKLEPQANEKGELYSEDLKERRTTPV